MTIFYRNINSTYGRKISMISSMTLLDLGAECEDNQRRGKKDDRSKSTTHAVHTLSTETKPPNAAGNVENTTIPEYNIAVRRDCFDLILNMKRKQLIVDVTRINGTTKGYTKPIFQTDQPTAKD